jgi:hypothetical protein
VKALSSATHSRQTTISKEEKEGEEYQRYNF